MEENIKTIVKYITIGISEDEKQFCISFVDWGTRTYNERTDIEDKNFNRIKRVFNKFQKLTKKKMSRKIKRRK